MKFNFSLRGRQPTDARFTFVKGGMPDTQWELYVTLLSRLLMAVGQPMDEDHSLRLLVRQNDPAFVGWLTRYFMDKPHFRPLAFFLSAELAVWPGNDEQAAVLLRQLLRQPSDVAEWWGLFSGSDQRVQKPGRAVKKVLETALQRLDEYSFSRCSAEVRTRLKTVLHVLRPKPVDGLQKSLFSRIAKDGVVVRSGWEQEWHALYQQSYSSPEQRQVVLRDKWKEGISTFRIGYSALLDNLQPMLCAGVSGKVLKLASGYIGSAAAVAQNDVSPLRLLDVQRGLRQADQGGARMLSEALEQAALHSSWSQSDFGKNEVSVIAMDVSNSMRVVLPGTRLVFRFDIAPLLAQLLKIRGEKVIAGIIGNTWKPIDQAVRPALSGVDMLWQREGEAGYAINAHLILQDLLRKKQVVDNVLIFTDCRLWDNRRFNQSADTDVRYWWNIYRQRVAPNAKLFLFDLSGSGAAPLEISDEQVVQISGWHDKLPDVLAALEKSREVLDENWIFSR